MGIVWGQGEGGRGREREGEGGRGRERERERGREKITHHQRTSYLTSVIKQLVTCV